ncbi:hypothetical protein MD484_g3508, partial [Candolleomyces efflorescens]
MTPTKIHFTKEEKRQAHAAASLRHYEKSVPHLNARLTFLNIIRKRDDINALRRLQYARNRKCS